MSAFAEAAPSGASHLRLVLIDSNNLNHGAVEQQVKLAPVGFAFSALDHH
jgi:hypothetical protein